MIVDLSANELYTDSYFNIVSALSEEKRFNICWGGSGSSKSHSYYQKYIQDLLIEKDYDYIAFRKYHTTIEESIYKGFKEIISNWGLTDLFTFTKKPYLIKNKETGRYIIFKGLDDTEKIKSMVNFKYCLLEEATEFAKSDFLEINRRLRGIEGIQISLVFNPVSHTHWIKKHFFDTDIMKDKTTFTKCSYKDNQFLTKDDVQELLDLEFVDENDYRVYVLGEWGILTERLVFKNWSIIDEIPKGLKRLPSGMDFGFSPDPATLTDVYINDKDLYLDERIYEQGLTNIETGNALQPSIQQRLKEIEFDKDIYIIADSSEPKSITEIRDAGFNVYGVRKYPGSISDGIKLMKGYRIHITRRSKNVINEFENYVKKIDKNGVILPQPIDAFNHSIDPIRYVLLMKGRLWN